MFKFKKSVAILGILVVICGSMSACAIQSTSNYEKEETSDSLITFIGYADEDYIKIAEEHGILFNGTPKRLERLNAVGSANTSTTNGSSSSAASNIAAAYAELDYKPTIADYEKYSEDESLVNWHNKAIEWVKYRLSGSMKGNADLALSGSPITRTALQVEMLKEGFTEEDIASAMDKFSLCTQALEYVNTFIDNCKINDSFYFTPKFLYAAFSESEIDYALSKVSICWEVQAERCAVSALSDMSLNTNLHEDIRNLLSNEGFNDDQISYALSAALPREFHLPDPSELKGVYTYQAPSTSYADYAEITICSQMGWIKTEDTDLLAIPVYLRNAKDSSHRLDVPSLSVYTTSDKGTGVHTLWVDGTDCLYAFEKRPLESVAYENYYKTGSTSVNLAANEGYLSLILFNYGDTRDYYLRNWTLEDSDGVEHDERIFFHINEDGSISFLNYKDDKKKTLYCTNSSNFSTYITSNIEILSKGGIKYAKIPITVTNNNDTAYYWYCSVDLVNDSNKYMDLSFDFNDNIMNKVTLNGSKVRPKADVSGFLYFELTGSGTYTLYAEDKRSGRESLTFTVS